MGKHSMLSLTALAVLGLSALTLAVPPTPAPAAGPAATPQIARGEYLVKIMACHDCHTPWKMGDRGPEPDMTRMLSVHPQDMAVTPPPALPAEGQRRVSGVGAVKPRGEIFLANIRLERSWRGRPLVHLLLSATRDNSSGAVTAVTKLRCRRQRIETCIGDSPAR